MSINYKIIFLIRHIKRAELSEFDPRLSEGRRALSEFDPRLSEFDPRLSDRLK